MSTNINCYASITTQFFLDFSPQLASIMLICDNPQLEISKTGLACHHISPKQDNKLPNRFGSPHYLNNTRWRAIQQINFLTPQFRLQRCKIYIFVNLGVNKYRNILGFNTIQIFCQPALHYICKPNSKIFNLF